MKEHYTGAAHINVMTSDIEESIRFYEKIGGELLQRDSRPDGAGTKYLALLSFGGYVLEFIQPAKAEKRPEGVIAHFAVYVDDVDKAAEDLRKLGVDTFLNQEKTVLPDLFGGLENWFFLGPSGEKVELLRML